ncbi:MAG: response regulator [Sulfuritalea sp.]|jgi:hypothetical protein|nr:response regulator [Sulfuritalea sp.]
MPSENYQALVLIVDDAPTNIQVLAETLRADYRVKVATSGQAALDIVDRDRPDLILLDVMMAGMDGYEVCRRLKDNPDTQGIPVIFVTARSEAQDEQRGLRLGAVDYISKPFHPAIVKARVHNHVNLGLTAAVLQEREAQLNLLVADLAQAKAQAEMARAEAERANAAKSHFLAAASHDLRQPLHAMDIYVRLIAAAVPPDSACLVDKMKQCSGDLSMLLNELLDLSKLNAGALEPRVSVFPLAAFLDQIATIHEPSAEQKGLLFRVARTRLVARTDNQLLRQLVANAVRYTARGSVLLGVRRRESKLWIEVWDTGIGIPADKREEIFEPFRQLDNPARNLEQGSGLGLALVRSLAKVLGLQIRVASRVGRGSLFAVEVPRGTVVAAGGVTERRIAPERRRRRLRVALVEDHAFVREAMTRGLMLLGHEVVAAADVVELLAGLDGLAPDIIVADYRLKGGSIGSDAIAMVRKCYGDRIGAVVVTGETDPDVVRSITDSGLRILQKPVQLDALEVFLNEFGVDSQPEAA